VRPPNVVVSDPVSDLGAGVVEIEEQGSLSSSSRIRPLKLSMNPFCIGFPGAMKCQSMMVSLHQASMSKNGTAVRRGRLRTATGIDARKAYAVPDKIYNALFLQRPLDPCRIDRT
jgi:hypothetical protein